MPIGTYSPDPFEQYCDDNGNPLSNGSIAVFAGGTTVPINTYSDVTLSVPNSNPIQLDAGGRPTSGAIFLTPGIAYKYILKDLNAAVIATRDFVSAVPLNTGQTGTWTPVIGGSTSTSGQTYGFQFGTFIKLGTWILVTYSLQLTTKGTIAGSLQLQGLPFPSAAGFTMGNPVAQWQNSSTPLVNMSTLILTGGSVATITGIGAASVNSISPLTTADITDTFLMLGMFVYTAVS